MLTNFGWKAVLGILVANAIYYLRFRRELAELRPKPEKGESEQHSIPIGSLSSISFLWPGWSLWHIIHFSLFSVFCFSSHSLNATRRYQVVTSLRGPLLVGFFLLALVIHGSIEQWWIEPVLSSLSEWPLMIQNGTCAVAIAVTGSLLVSQAAHPALANLTANIANNRQVSLRRRRNQLQSR